LSRRILRAFGNKLETLICPGAWHHNDFSIAHGSRSPSLHFHLLCRGLKKPGYRQDTLASSRKAAFSQLFKRFNGHQTPVAVLPWDAVWVSAQFAG
jgi:hypothetical protein